MAQIQVNVVEARNLKKKDLFSENDPYVKVYLVNSHFPKQKTTVKSNTKDPVWNQILILSHLEGLNTLQVDVYDKDRIKDDKIGSVTIDLTDLYDKKCIDEWFTLLSSIRKVDRGAIHLIIEYKPLAF